MGNKSKHQIKRELSYQATVRVAATSPRKVSHRFEA